MFEPSKGEGAGKAGCRPHPWPASRKKAGGENHRFGQSIPAFPARWFTAYSALSSGTGLSCPRRSPAHLSPCELSLSVGRPGPHAFTVRTGDARLASPSRPSHPALTFVTTRNAPHVEAGCGELLPIFRKSQADILQTRLGRPNTLDRTSEFRRFAHGMLASGRRVGRAKRLSSGKSLAAALSDEPVGCGWPSSTRPLWCASARRVAEAIVSFERVTSAAPTF